MPRATKAHKDLLTRIRQDFKLAAEADQTNRRMALEDMKFINVPGCQWEENMKKERGDRPCYEFNKLRVTCKRIINDMRANRPQGKVRGVEDTDKDTAEIYEGLIRNIWNVSDGDTIIDYAAEYQVGSGMGAWRITTDYVAEDAFEQEVRVEEIANPFCLYADPSAKDLLKADAKYWILTEKISKKAYEKKWPKAAVVDWDSSEFDDDEDWMGDESVRICEYWWKEPYKKEIWQLEDGKVVDSESDEAQAILESTPEIIKQKRVAMCDKVMMCIASGDAILEGPTEWAGKHLPFVMIFGEYMIVDGKTYWFGVGRFAKDAQRSYNVSRTAITETIAQAPQAKWWATPDQAKGHTEKWAEAHKKNFPFLLANPDPKAPGFPQRMGGAEVPVALIQESQIASEEIKAVTGIFDDDLGNQSRSQSGRAIYARQQQGQIATFNYQDNLAKGIRRTWEILIDLIPKIYDTERDLRVLGSDGADDYVKVNTFAYDQQGEPIRINDLAAGRYDVTVTVGPNFSTKRQEAAEIYQQLTQANPQIFGVAGDLIFRSMDLPYSEDIAERLKMMLPPPIQDMINQKDVPPEVQMMMQQAQQAMQMIQQMAAELQEAAKEAEISKAEAEKLLANVKTEEARFEAKIAKEMAGVAQKDATNTLRLYTQEREGMLGEDKAQFAQELAQYLQGIQQIVGEFAEYAQGAMQEIEQRKQMDTRPRVVRVETKRENGKLTAIPIYEESA